jgi:hypothetical protein
MFASGVSVRSRAVRILGAALILSIAACSSGPTIRSNLDKTADFSRYSTYGFFDEPAGSTAPYESIGRRHLKSAIDREMQARGFKPSEQPELLVNIHVEQKDKVQVSQEPAGYGGYYGYRAGMYGWGAGTYTSVDQYTEGTLNIDVVDRAQKKLLWEGIAIGRITQRMYENLEPTIDAVVKDVFLKFPTQPPQTPVQ